MRKGERTRSCELQAGSAYFYADDDVAFYDDTSQATDRAYDLVHDVTSRVLCNFLNQAHDLESGTRVWVLDVGCGSGAEAMRLLAELQQVCLFCIDNSAAMLDCFRTKVTNAYGNDSADGRLILAQADFREPGWLDTALLSHHPLALQACFDAAVSVYALHHLTSDAKREVYATIADQLRSGSLFVNADLYSFGTPWLAQLAHQEEEDWIIQQFDTKCSSSNWLASKLGPKRVILRDAWIKHLRDENTPLPLGGSGIGSNGAHHAVEEDLLHSAGFSVIEVVARHFQSAVAVAIK